MTELYNFNSVLLALFLFTSSCQTCKVLGLLVWTCRPGRLMGNISFFHSIPKGRLEMKINYTIDIGS
jgi:hypothetical protein